MTPHLGSPGNPSRRRFLAGTTAALAGGGVWSGSAVRGFAAEPRGLIRGEPTAEKVGEEVLADGGNAIDAIVAAALTAAVAAPHMTGIGGYGGCLMVAFAGGPGRSPQIASLEFNSTAPRALRPDTFRPDAQGKVPGQIHDRGWLAAGVPGVLAGLQRALERFGTRSFRQSVQPAIRLAREGYPIPAGLAASIRGQASVFARDPASAELYLPGGQPRRAGETFRNPELATLLETLAERNSVDSFYRGDLAERIAAAFQQNGGLVTTDDLAAYRVREEQPLTLTWGESTIHTSPPTAGGISVLQALGILQALPWESLPNDWRRSHARVEAMRWAWRDRLALVGDPDFVPRESLAKLTSPEYWRESAQQIAAVVKEGKFIPHRAKPREQSGTIHLSAADSGGNFAALTLTHGGAFGARVTVPGLGLTLGHGMSRFDPQPDHPNAPGPGKRPLHNMCPCLVTRGGRAVLAVGGRGGRRIPDAVFECLTQFVVSGKDLESSLAAPRMHTEGTPAVSLEKHWPAEEVTALRGVGYQLSQSASATLSAVALEAGSLRSGMR